ncbi:MerR family transcriptional regulator [Paenibacillus gansuensis]|uniref:B12-binding domain-containing protein n=1 Tax=Paenibacillus gansuensis TaxID=306542 RepID=A0ABW5PC34_9BACL
MMNQQRLYTIKEVSLRSGLSTQLIRKWEERYQAVTPERFPNGYRGYTSEHIDTLAWLKRRVDEGVPINLAVKERQMIGTLPASSPAEGLLQASSDRNPSSHSVSEPRGEVREYQKTLIRHLINLDADSSQRWFDQLLALHSMDFVLQQIIQPVLVEIGELWERNEISEYQEHFGSHFLRERLLAMKNMYQAMPDSPLIVTACGPRERHELGILFFGFYALQLGFQIVYLGASPAEKGIMDCLEQLKPAAFTFSYSTNVLFAETIPFLKELDKRIVELGLATKVFLGGRIFEKDELLEGTKRVHMISGQGKETVLKVKQLLDTNG